MTIHIVGIFAVCQTYFCIRCRDSTGADWVCPVLYITVMGMFTFNMFGLPGIWEVAGSCTSKKTLPLQ